MGFFGQWIEADTDTFESAAARLRVVEVFWTDPDPQVVQRANRAGDALIAWQVGSPEQAARAEGAGCDFVIVQGVEAGGHVRGTAPRMQLLEDVLGLVTIPVVLAGGIATADDVRAAIDAGAAAARVGTRFVATDESSAHPAYVDALISAKSGADTVLTTTFYGGWPDAPPDINVRGQVEAMALYAGEGVGAVRAMTPARDVVAELVAGLDPGAGRAQRVAR